MNLQILNPLRWRKSFLILLLVGFLVLWFGFLDTYSVYTRYNLKKEQDELKAKIERLEAETDSLNAAIEALKKDSTLLEKIAREEYGMRKRGETVYRVREGSK